MKPKSKIVERGGISETLDQEKLNISARSRTSRLPWRGQFSPELIEYFLEAVCPNSGHILDPFCGSGTVLFEALQRGAVATGAEVNPAAWHLTSLATFATLEKSRQSDIIARLRQIIAASADQDSLFSEGRLCDPQEFLKRGSNEPFLIMALAAAAILGMGNRTELTSAAMAAGCFAVLNLLKDAGDLKSEAQCFLADARRLPLGDGSADAVITSPPYINVFNYHQNYRPAVELLGWKPLQAAQSEIGANRKFRGNRFLTVVQYCIDMQHSFAEMSRVLQDGSPLIIVLGRTSNVLGTPFLNGEIMLKLLRASSHFEIERQAERVFVSRFGGHIFEDIIVARKISVGEPDLALGRKIGVDALKKGLQSVPDKNRGTLTEAIEKGSEVSASPLLNLTIPSAFNRTA